METLSAIRTYSCCL